MSNEFAIRNDHAELIDTVRLNANSLIYIQQKCKTGKCEAEASKFTPEQKEACKKVDPADDGKLSEVIADPTNKCHLTATQLDGFVCDTGKVI